MDSPEEHCGGKRVLPALPGDTGFWGETKRVVIAGHEVGRICPDCNQFCSYGRSSFIQLHGARRDGTRKCTKVPLPPEEGVPWEPGPWAQRAESSAAAAAGGGCGGGCGGGDSAAVLAETELSPAAMVHAPTQSPAAAAAAAAAADDSPLPQSLPTGAALPLPMVSTPPPPSALTGEVEANHLSADAALGDADAMQVDFDYFPGASEEGVLWYDTAEAADWLDHGEEDINGGEEEPEDAEGVGLFSGDDVASGAAFADARTLFEAMCHAGHVSDDMRSDLQEVFGEPFVAALESDQQQPDSLLPEGEQARCVGRIEAEINHLAELLGKDGEDLTQEQIQVLNQRLQQQQQQAEGGQVGQDDDQEWCEFDQAAEGVEFSMQQEGVAFEVADIPDKVRGGKSVEHYKALLQAPMWHCHDETSQLRLCQAIFLLMAWKLDYVVRDAAFVALLGILCSFMLPKGHNLPATMYIFKQLLEVQDISTVERHSCEMGCTGWPVTPKGEWDAHRHDTCPKCGGKRFKTVMGRLVPVRRFWYIPLDDSIKELMSDPDFVKALKAPRLVRPGSFWASPEYKRLNKALGSVLDNQEHGVVELGFDFAEPYIFAQHSTGLMFMRYASLPEGASAKRKWHRLVMIIEGPNEPYVMDAFLEPLVDDLVHLAPPKPERHACAHPSHAQSDAAGGVRVEPAIGCDEHGNPQKGEPFTHYAVLGGVYADSPARAKLMYTIASWISYLACPFCKLMGTLVNKVVRYLGYAAPVTTTRGLGKDKSYQMGRPDGRLMTDREIKAQAIGAELYRSRGVEPPPGNRFKGHSPLLRRLYYVNPVRLWVIPFCHAFHLGVVKNFLSNLMGKSKKGKAAAGMEATGNPLRMPDAERRIVRGRMPGMQLHPSFNRKFRDPCSSLASWQIDDCARALQCFLPMLLRPARSGQLELQLLQPPAAKKAFGHLKRFAAFHLGHVQYDTLAEYKEAAKESIQELLAYGALMEKCVERGTTHELFELWVERLIGEFKQRVKYRTRSEPEKTMVGDDLAKRALSRWRLKYPDVFTWQEHCGRGKGLQAAGSASVCGAVLGVARLPTPETWSPRLQASIQTKVIQVMRDSTLKQTWLDNWEQVAVTVYTEALLSGGHYANSTAHPGVRTRDGSFVMVPYTRPHAQSVQFHVAQVRHYVQLSLPASASTRLEQGMSPVLLVAVCDFLPYMQPFDDKDICGHDSIVLFGRDRGSRQDTFTSRDYPVLLADVDSPLFRQEYKGHDGCTCWSFVPLSFRARGKQRAM